MQGRLVLDTIFDGRTRTAPNGVLYVVSGGGGAELHDSLFTRDPSKWEPFTAKLIADCHSFTVLDVGDAAVTLRQIDDRGREIDRIVVRASQRNRGHGRNRLKHGGFGAH